MTATRRVLCSLALIWAVAERCGLNLGVGAAQPAYAALNVLDKSGNSVASLYRRRPRDPSRSPAEAATTETQLAFELEPGATGDRRPHGSPRRGVGASFALYDPTLSLSVSVRGASGRVLELTPGPNGVVDPASLVKPGYGSKNPAPGP